MLSMVSERTKGVVACIALAFVFAIIGVFARELDVGFSIYQQIYLRIGFAFLLAAIVFSPYVSWRKEFAAPPRDWVIVALRGILMYIGVVFHTYGILNANYGNVAFLTVLPIFPLIGYLFFKEHFSSAVWLYVGVGFVGALLLSVREWGTLTFGLGELSTLVAILFFGFAYVGRKLQSSAMGNAAMATGMFFFGSLALFGTSVLMGDSLPSAALFTPWVLLMIIVAGLLNVLHVTLTNYSFSVLSVTLAGTILMLESLFGLGVSVVLYGEYPTLAALCGGALILLSIYNINRLT